MHSYNSYKPCIEACMTCASLCNHCASCCAAENDIKMMGKCIQLDMECAAICYLSAQLMSLGSERAKDICIICADICNQCSIECGKHESEHCKQCSIAGRNCSDECLKMAAA